MNAHISHNFWENHSIINILGWLLFPRIMFWFFSTITGGFFFWVGVLLVPRIMGAFWLTYYYWHANPFVCIIAWLLCIKSEASEKEAIGKI